MEKVDFFPRVESLPSGIHLYLEDEIGYRVCLRKFREGVRSQTIVFDEAKLPKSMDASKIWA